MEEELVEDLTEKLIEAVIRNDAELVYDLIMNGADPSVTLDSDNITPLHFAAQNNALDVVPLLIAGGADIHAQTWPDGKTPLSIAQLHNHYQMITLLLAYDSSNIDSVH